MRIGISNGKTHPAIVAEASAWFIEFRAGDVTGDARQKFIEWLRRSPEHIQAYLEVSGVWAELPTSDPQGKIDIAALIARARSEADVIALSPDAPRPANSSAAVEPPSMRQGRTPIKLRRGGAVAAMAALALLASVTAVYFLGGDSRGSYSTGIGEQRTVQLADGSTVELNARSKIEVHLSARQRDVALLEGQALFRVAKDKQRPFVVRAGDAEVRAVGTAFDVYRKQAGTVVTVVEGRVETYDESGGGGAAAIVLSAGEQLTVAPHTLPKPTHTDPSVATAWVQKRLIFEETPLSDVAEEFNRYNRRPLSIDDRELEKLRISGVYSSTDPTSLINFLRSQNTIQVIESEKQVRVLRREAR
ncbi:MAG TPA: FecR family protein [Steroidobacteraceae bacterium]